MLLKIISYIPSIVSLLIIGLFVLLNNSKSLRNRIFASLNLIVALWLFFLFLADTTTHIHFALWALRVGLLFGTLVFLFFYYFSLVFPRSLKVSKTKLIFYSLPLIIIAILSLTPLTVSTVSIESFGVRPVNVGLFYTIGDFVGVIYMLGGMAILAAKYKKSNFSEKNQIKFFTVGLFIALVVNIFTGIVLTLLNTDTKFILFGSFSLVIFSSFVAYAMLRHSFFDIRSLAVRAVTYVLTLLVVSVIFIAPTVILTGHLINSPLSLKTLIVLTIIMLAIASVYESLRTYFNRVTNRTFFRDYYEPQEVLDRLSNLLVGTVNTLEIEKKSSEIIAGALRPTFLRYLLITEGGKAELQVLHALTKEPKNILIQDELEDNHHAQLREIMKDNNIAIAVRLRTRHEDLGFMLLGYKQSGGVYTQNDSQLLGIAADEIAVGLQNALRFEEIQQFNITLQQKIEEATKQLQKANSKLRELDKTKDEFISMASHQLRTPLTTVKGYLSMILDGDIGAVKKDQREMIQHAFDGANRMVYLIADLLNVSRLQTGKFVIDNKPTNLAEVIESEVSQLDEQVTNREVKLAYHKPDGFPVLNLDETKIRQVIMNFLDNALYYTPRGGSISVDLQATDKEVSYTVTDTGVGVPKDVQHHLFSKFYRADNARKMRPDGTGLGLYMAKKVIAAQGGAIIFKSTEGKGSIFGFSFPRKSAEIKEVAPKAKPAKTKT
jgi:signal transduction histidine kinase